MLGFYSDSKVIARNCQFQFGFAKKCQFFTARPPRISLIGRKEKERKNPADREISEMLKPVTQLLTSVLF